MQPLDKMQAELAEEPARKPKYWYCDYCDGCGWVEGGEAIKTPCRECGGHGVVLTAGLKVLTPQQVEEVKEIIAAQEAGQWSEP